MCVHIGCICLTFLPCVVSYEVAAHVRRASPMCRRCSCNVSGQRLMGKIRLDLGPSVNTELCATVCTQIQTNTDKYRQIQTNTDTNTDKYRQIQTQIQTNVEWRYLNTKLFVFVFLFRDRRIFVFIFGCYFQTNIIYYICIPFCIFSITFINQFVFVFLKLLHIRGWRIRDI